MLLIADSGSTKTDWILIDEGKNQSRYNTIGYNPYFIDTEKIAQSLTSTLISQLDSSKVKKIFFYGAGCSTPEKAAVVFKALSKCFASAEIYVNHDMLAAARALLGNTRGFAAIIGTGSNTCIYDGKEVEKNIDSLGYLLGDEGSGCYIGKKIVRDFLRGHLPPELQQKFDQKYHLTYAEILDSLYNKPLPNRFLAGFCKFADENKQHAHIQKIVKESFTDFFENLVSRYSGYEKLSFNCVGSVGFIFKEILSEVGRSHNMKIGRLIASPIDDLVNYHIDNEL
ncbi:MAG: N-acetylglucosamine kinase [Bacteroidetes bacterium]|nr:N-acetylglucosamine kinase [Bacteroidota bacterium]